MLTNDAWDPKSGTSEFKATAVRIEKIGARKAAQTAAHPSPLPAAGADGWICTCRQAEPTALERDAIDGAFAGLAHPTVHDDRPMRSAHAGHDARAQRHLLLPVLHAVQDAAGWISEGALNHIARTLSVPPAEIYGVATFYAMFSVEPRAPRVVHVCDDVACGPYGGEDIAAALTDALGPEGAGQDACWVRSPCLGLCERAPVVLHQRAGEPDLSQAPAAADDVLAATRAAGAGAADQADAVFGDTRVSAPQTGPGGTLPGGEPLRLLRRIGVVDPGSLDDYRAHGGYAALRRAIDMGPTRVITELEDSSLTGRGGAAFPTGVKWKGVAGAPERPHYLVCNADESEPGHVQGPRAHGGRPVRPDRGR